MNLSAPKNVTFYVAAILGMNKPGVDVHFTVLIGLIYAQLAIEFVNRLPRAVAHVKMNAAIKHIAAAFPGG